MVIIRTVAKPKLVQCWKIVLLMLFVAVPTVSLAASSYGSGSYGDGLYNVGASASTGSSGGSSSGSGSRITTPTTPATPLPYLPTPSPASTTPFFFSRTLTVGQTGLDVQVLQRYLNKKGFTVALTGPGSPGNETLMFGALTRAALARFQKANNIYPPIGFFGPITKAFVNAHP